MTITHPSPQYSTRPFAACDGEKETRGQAKQNAINASKYDASTIRLLIGSRIGCWGLEYYDLAWLVGWLVG